MWATTLAITKHMLELLARIIHGGVDFLEVSGDYTGRFTYDSVVETRSYMTNRKPHSP